MLWSRRGRVAKHTCTKLQLHLCLRNGSKVCCTPSTRVGGAMGGGCATGCCHFDSPCARANFDYSPPGNRRRRKRRQRQTHTINRFLAYYALLGHPPFPPLFHALPTRFTYVCVCIKSSIKAKLPSVLCVSCRYKHTYPCPALPSLCVASYNQIYAYLRQIFQHSLCCCCCCRITHYVRNYNDDVHY